MLVEYALVQHILFHAPLIAGERVATLTRDDPTELRKSLERYYSTQIHGDVFDLQLHWGITFEIKSTTDPSKVSLHKTVAWGPSAGVNASLTTYPAQYYVIALMKNDIEMRDGGLHFDDIDLYVSSGRQIDKLARGQKSIRFSKIIKGRKAVSFSSLWKALKEEIDADLKMITEKLEPNWKRPKLEIDQVDGVQYIPTAMEYKDCVTLGWMQVSPDSSASQVAKIEWPWKPGVKPSGRDWEAAGFCYEDRRRHPLSGGTGTGPLNKTIKGKRVAVPQPRKAKDQTKSESS